MSSDPHVNRIAESSHYVVFENLNQIRDIFQAKANGEIQHDTLVIDTLTGIQSEQVKRYSTPKINGKVNPQYFDTKRPHEEIPALIDYLLSKYLWHPAFSLMSQQNLMHVQINCHVRENDNGQFYPSVPDAIYESLHGFTNMVSYMDSNSQGERTLRTQTSRAFIGKCQLDLPSVASDDEYVEGVRKWLKLN